MSSITRKMQRLGLLVQLIEIRPHSKAELIEKVQEEDHSYSDRSFDRDLSELRNEFFLNIQYQKEKRGYVFDGSPDLDRFQTILQINHLAETLNANLQDKDLGEIVQFDQPRVLGMEHLNKMISAIKNERQIQFTYFKYDTQETKEYIGFPLMLKEYMYRWYVMAWVPDYGECRTFGLDRFIRFEIKGDTFKRKTYRKHTKNFESVVGLNYSNGPVQKVKIACTKHQAFYLTSAPWHPSMRERKSESTTERKVFTLDVIPNFELEQKILAMGQGAEVLQPESLRDAVKFQLTKMAQVYK